MHHPAVAHTLAIYARIYNHLPPLVPFEIQKKFKTELDRLSSTDTVSLEEVETLMAPFAHEVWHYLKAFDEILALHEQTLGEKTLLQKVSPGLKKKYTLVTKIGGGFRQLLRGTIADHFDHDEKCELTALLVELKRDVRRYAMQAVLTHDRATYEQKIEYYGAMISEVNETIVKLQELVEQNRDIDPELAEEIIGKIRAIEQSFSFIGPEMDMNEIRHAPAYYEGRRHERKIRWGK